MSFLELDPFVGKPVVETWPSCATSVIEPIALFGRHKCLKEQAAQGKIFLEHHASKPLALHG